MRGRPAQNREAARVAAEKNFAGARIGDQSHRSTPRFKLDRSLGVCTRRPIQLRTARKVPNTKQPFVNLPSLRMPLKNTLSAIPFRMFENTAL